MLKTRIITATLLIAALLPAMFMASSFTWAAMMLVVSILAVYEWAKLVNLSQVVSIGYALVYAALGIALLMAISTLGFHWLMSLSFIVFVGSAFFWLLVVPLLMKKCVVVENKVLLMLIGFLLIAPLWLALIFAKGADPWLLLTLLATIWLADSAAYFAGKNFGKHKLAPNISPGKTWEGVLGALLAVTVLGFVLMISGRVTSLAVFPLLWLVAGSGVVGDLFESLIKRQFGKKDSGTLLPGHGGILDRIDGLLPSLPIAVLMIYLFYYFQAVS
ncbi:MAG: phosphatidate cytidylyltransferase [Methylophilaceae bacterium]|jgi:phosphatidate cytidylyltransferase|tara:strand:+ start:42789 stop:43610 length:822 start_codon:yes stop_codon:yes gene_type:complete